MCPNLLKCNFPHEGEYWHLDKILKKLYGERYNIDIRVINAKDYGIAQSRPRAIIKIWKRDYPGLGQLLRKR